MLPWLGPWGTGQAEAAEGPGLSTGGAHGEAWRPGEDTMERQDPPVQDSAPRPALSPPEPGRKPPPPSRRPAAAPAAEAPVARPPQVTSQVTASRMAPRPLQDPGHQAKAGPQLLVSGGLCGSGPRSQRCHERWSAVTSGSPQGAGRGPGVTLSGRTLCHPSWPLYDDWGRVPAPSGQPAGEQAGTRDAGLPVTNYEDVFLLDPLLPRGQRVPVCLPKPPQQACPSTWLSEAEMIALAGLLQMSQGEPTPSSRAGALPATGCADPVAAVSEDPGPSGGQSCSGSADP
ncbi:histone deacetylase complex subunit SAP25 isoform X2 [Apodemus sylvaticus]|uniref:histone deacetylase complex subunit SAP25 isoform X2 n=1 Tax=Apodemus sylvaticus TaxID=10129 RepID=UPI00224376CF|nr:histone deacetylase complex subunit SAP25 isoform X2 [Apodemus sylvaticus]